MIHYGFTKELDVDFAKAVDIVTKALKDEGFGIISTIDLKAKFKEKLGVEFKNYVILGACNPKRAYEAVMAEENIGLMLPCNIIVYEKGDKCVVSIFKPTVAMQRVESPNLQQLAVEVESSLQKVFKTL